MNRLIVITIKMMIISASCVAHAESLNLVTTNAEPFQGETLAHQGFISAISRAIFSQSGYSVNLSFRPLKESIMEARRGKYDGVIGAYQTKDRTHGFLYTLPVFRVEQRFVQIKDRGITYTRMDDLRRFKVGSSTGAAYTEDLRGFGIETHEFDTEIDLLKAVHTGKIDLALISKQQFEYQLKSPELIKLQHDLELLDRAFKTYDLFCSISKKHKEAKKIVGKFNEAMKDMKQDGTYQQLLHKFGQRKHADL